MSQKILFISAHAPTNKYPQAGQKIALSNLQEYQKNSIKLDIVVIANHQEIAVATDLHSQFPENLFTYSLSKFSKIKSCLIKLHLPWKFATRDHPIVAKYLQQILTQNQYDIIHFEYTHAAVYLDLIWKYSTDTSQTQIIISIHDIITQSMLRQTSQFPLLGIETARIFNYEKRIYHQAHQLWVLSGKDRDILTSLFSVNPDAILVKPPKLSSFIEQLQRRKQTIVPKTLMFWGAMNRPENEQAVLIFIEQCFREIISKDPAYKLYIVGSHPSERLRSRANPNIIITGFIEDPTPYFTMVEWGIVPLITGAGIKLKTLEMLAAGIPVISTSVGAEGIDRYIDNLIVNDNIRQWIDLIVANSES